MKAKGRRTKGHAYEREIAEKFRKAGYPECVTSRSESKRTDDLGIDLCYTDPWQVQCKNQERISPAPHDILANMPQNQKLNVLFHKRNRKGTIVSMDEDTFWALLRCWQEG
jgi:hypothetical protein